MNEDKIINKLIDHEDRLERIEQKMVTKDEFQEFRSAMMDGQDKMITILQRLDEERIFTNKWISEIEKQVENNSKEIKQIKIRLKVA